MENQPQGETASAIPSARIPTTPATGVAQALSELAGHALPLHHFDLSSHALKDVAGAIAELANAAHLELIAKYGSDEDRAAVVTYIKKSRAPFYQT